jgi:hypothetical protein
VSRDHTIRVIAVVIAATGALVVWRSTPWGVLALDSVLSSVGSLTGESQHAAVYAGSMAAWRTIGGIFLGVGLFRALGPTGKE